MFETVVIKTDDSFELSIINVSTIDLNGISIPQDEENHASIFIQ